MNLIKLLLKYLIFILFLILPANQAFANRFSAVIDSSEIYIGSRAILSLKAEISNDKIIFPSLGDSLNFVKIISVSAIDTITENNKKYLHQKVYLTSFESDTYYFSPIVFITIGSNNSSKIYNCSIGNLVVKDVDISKMSDINEIKNYIDEKKQLLDYKLYFISVLLLILLIILIKKLSNRIIKTPLAKNEIKEINIDPNQYLLDELNSLKNRELWKSSEFKIHYTLLSDAFRRYFELKKYFPALEYTSSQIEESLKSILEKDTLNELNDILRQSDLVKFAKYIPTEIEVIEHLERSFDLYNKL